MANLTATHAYYRPLRNNEFRLIEIQPGPKKSAVECRLVTLPLNADTPHFRALSYAWGDATNRTEIMLDGHVFSITTSLFEALLQLRESMYDIRNVEVLPLWADAICINQLDVDEKSKQVPRMREIYSSAHDVLVWLGPWNIFPDGKFSKSDISSCLSIFSPPANYSAFKQGTQRQLRPSLVRKMRRYREESIVLGLFVYAPWFSRKWVVQEAVLASCEPVVMLGRNRTDLSGLMNGIMMLHRGIDEPVIHNPIKYLQEARAQVKEVNSSRCSSPPTNAAQNLAYALANFKWHRTTLPVDHLYSLLALLPDHSLPRHLHPDYSVSYEQVYRDYAAYMMGTTGDLTMLSNFTSDLGKGPTWVPNFGRVGISGIAGMALNRKDPSITNKPTFSADRSIMTVLGVIEHRCEAVFMPTPYFTNRGRRLSTRMNPKDSFWDIENWVIRMRARHRRKMDRQFSSGKNTAVNEVSDGVLAKLSSDPFHHLALNRGKPIVFTSDGVVYSTMPPCAPRKGDLVCVLKGAVYACILRRVKNGYAFKGSAEPATLPLYDEEFFAAREVLSFNLV